MSRPLLVLTWLAALAAPVSAQTLYDDLQVLRAQVLADRKAVVADNLGLTAEESAPFWETWERYQAKVNEVRRARLDLVLDFVESRETMSDDEAIAMLERAIEVKRAFADLEAKWVKEFRQVLPARKVARYFQIENKIDALINVELAAQVPLTR
jgi:hypothetical protein